MKKSFFKYIIPIAFLFILTAFNFRDVMVGSWNPQYIYNTNGKSLIDFSFADSLNGYMTLRKYSLDHPSSIMKTINGGYNWFISMDYPPNSTILKNICVLNKDTVLICEGFTIIKTTNGGQNWISDSLPGFLCFYIFAFNIDTIWAGAGTGFNQPQLYITTNGGITWTKKLELTTGGQFDGVYFYNKRNGFCWTSSNIYRTTDGGDNWFLLINETATEKIQFVDSLTGWKCDGFWHIKKTTNGGFNWTLQNLPSGGQIFFSTITDFCAINKDTLWGCGGNLKCPNGLNLRGILWKTTNGGTNWGYQLPDTNLIKYPGWNMIRFINSKIGWSYYSDSGSGIGTQGIHTTTGGNDTVFYVGVIEQTANVSSDFILYQNYPNPFNPVTSIKYNVESTKQIKIVVFDILGREITTLVNQKKKAGEYEVTFNAVSFSSGIYYYVLYADGVRMDAKKMVLMK